MARKSITVRVEETDAEALEALARKRRQETGNSVGLSDIVRGAISAYLDSQETGDGK